ncbi:hypothetical protein CWO84_02865 [Methylomonas sp. Kb3]|nr:hypothetical protein CWO84_02865 [Methylomonas sp. Kb3]
MIDKDEVLLSKQVGLRLAEARNDLCKLSQAKAAQLLGIDAGDLRLMEEGLKTVPITVVVAVARAFDLSADWILGLVADDWELDQETRRERDFLVALEKLHLESRAQQVAKQVEQDSKVAALSDAVALLGQAIQAIDDSFMIFWQKTQEFESFPGGAQVLNRVDQAICASRAATLSLVRAKALPIESLAALPQPRPAIRVWTPATAQLPQPVLPITESKPRTTRTRSNLTQSPTALAS